MNISYFSFVEPFLESVPQIHILLCLAVSEGTRTNSIVDFKRRDTLFIMTFATSVFSGGLGIAKFLKVGPCKFLSSKSGYLGGFVSLGTPFVVLSIITALVGKGLMLPVIAFDRRLGLSFHKVAVWIALNLVPQLCYVSIFPSY